MGNAIETIQPTKKRASQFLCYFVTFIFCSILVTAGYGAICLIMGGDKIKRGVILLCVALVIFIILKVLDYTFSWFDSQSISYAHKPIELTIADSMVSTFAGQTKIRFYKIDKIKYTHRDAILFGDFYRIECRQGKRVKKVKILEGSYNRPIVEHLKEKANAQVFDEKEE